MWIVAEPKNLNPIEDRTRARSVVESSMCRDVPGIRPRPRRPVDTSWLWLSNWVRALNIAHVGCRQIFAGAVVWVLLLSILPYSTRRQNRKRLGVTGFIVTSSKFHFQRRNNSGSLSRTGRISTSHLLVSSFAVLVLGSYVAKYDVRDVITNIAGAFLAGRYC